MIKCDKYGFKYYNENEEHEFIDGKKFQQKILDIISSEELDKFFNNTVFAEKENSDSYKAAMIHGMCVASMMVCYCEPVFIKIKNEQ